MPSRERRSIPHRARDAAASLSAVSGMAFLFAAPSALAQSIQDGTLLSRTAQDERGADEQEAQIAPPPVAQDQRPGRVANSTVGLAGERQARGQTVGGVVPMARIDSRVQNRVQSRIRNRIDRYYDPQANAVSPFEVAGDQARTAGRPRR